MTAQTGSEIGSELANFLDHHRDELLAEWQGCRKLRALRAEDLLTVSAAVTRLLQAMPVLMQDPNAAEGAGESAWLELRSTLEACDPVAVLVGLAELRDAALSRWQPGSPTMGSALRLAHATDRALALALTATVAARVRAEGEVRRREEEQRFRLEVEEGLGSSREREDILAKVASLSIRLLADGCLVDVIGSAEDLRRVLVVHRDPAMRVACDALERLPLDRARPHVTREAIETGQAVLYPDLDVPQLARMTQSPAHAALLTTLGLRSLMVVPLSAAGAMLGALAFFSSRDDRRYSREHLALAQELAHLAAVALDNARHYQSVQRAVRSRDAVLGIVAHDLRSPLSAAQITARMMLHASPEAESRRRCEVILRATARMKRLIGDLLDSAALESGRLHLDVSGFPAAPLLDDAVQAMRAQAGERSLQLMVSSTADLPEIQGDPDRLLQVFSNLIDNAIKFTPPGGLIVLGAHRQGREAVFSVRDSGPGIPPEQVSRVFETFWQGRRVERRGAGLGLSIARGIVEAHGGRIWVDSPPGQGATFVFTVPLVERGSEPLSPSAGGGDS